MHGVEPDQRMHNGDVPWWLTTLVLIAVLGLLAFLAGCVAMREEAYYHPKPQQRACPVPVCDGPCKEGRVLDCTSPSAIRGQRPPLTPAHP